MWTIRPLLLALLFGLLTVTLTACGGGGGGATVQVSWAANRETAVNGTGGGYKVYSSKTAGFDVATASSVDVPFTSGPTAPTSTTLRNLSTGTYFVKVVAYSALTPPGGNRGSTSAPSAEISVLVP